jgi:carbon monoxide dehydrogenase subunit G
MINRAMLLYLFYGVIVFFLMDAAPAESKGLLDILTFRREPQATSTVCVDELVHCQSVIASIAINAPPSAVWQAIHDERQVASDLVASKVLENNGDNYVLEQRWRILPILKDTSCTMSETEHANERIDFKLLSSDEFKVMQGSWLLKPSSSGEVTQLDLQMYFQLKRIGSSSLVRIIARRKMSRRLERIKEMAEATFSGLQVRGKVL